MIGEYNCLCKLEIITSVIELNLVHGANGKAWWNSNTPFSFSYKGGNSDKFYIKPSKPAQIIFVERGNGLVLIYFYPEQSDLILQNISGTIRSKIEYDTINKQFVVSNVQSTLYWILSNEKLKISSL